MSPAARSARRIVRVLAAIAAAAAIVVAYRLVDSFPGYLTRYINDRLRSIPDYDGAIGNANVDWSEARVVITGFRLEKRDWKAPAARISVARATLSWDWKSALRRRPVVTLILENPESSFLMRQRRPGMPRIYGVWQRFFARLPPFRAERVEIRNGLVHVRNDEDIPPLDLVFDQITGTLVHAANGESMASTEPVRLEAHARMMRQAPLAIDVQVRPFRPHADFDLKGDLERFDLRALNPVLRHYIGVDLEKGFLSVHGELSAGEGRFAGRVRRKIEEVDIHRKGEGGGLVRTFKEMFGEGWVKRRERAGILEGPYALAGPLGYMDEDLFLACMWVSKTAFLQSLRMDLPDSVKMGTPEKAEEEWMALQAEQRANQAADKGATAPRAR